MLTCNELYDLTMKPKINDITFELLREYYETFLSPYTYRYTIMRNIDGVIKEEIIELRFEENNFCHLLGVETTLQYNISKYELKEYTGISGWNKIKNGMLDFDFIKKKNKVGFKNNKSRYLYFYYLPKLIENPKGADFNCDKVIGKTKVQCELLFYDEFEEAYVHIGIDKKKFNNVYLGYYIPRTFLIEKITKYNDGKKYFLMQNKINVVKIKDEIS